MQIDWWYWVVGGLALVLAELTMATFYIIWFGLGAILVGLVAWVAPGLSATVQIALWIVASVAMAPGGHPNSPTDGHLKLPHLS